ncbi:unnamed protein product [Cylindrotheca closterium]|uniref:Uncharacterized protein n=1 Tax=Cylindrotheca closterium TaxID=2856 RepID=A0AAD2PUC4_9STRA|nr:unnamed protein product [Cylindrotheca closterium]
MPLMTNPNRRQRSRMPRLRRRSLPRLRMGNQHPQPQQPQHHDCEDHEETVAKDLHLDNPAKSPTKNRVKRRSYSLPRRLIRAKQQDAEDVDIRQESNETINTWLESSSDSVEVMIAREPKVSFGDNLVEKTFESLYDSQEEFEYDPTQLWYQEPDYTRFKKDRILTSFDYQASVQGKTNFNYEDHSIRGLETMIHPRYSKRVNLEKMDLWKALQKEEAHQKQTDKFPNLERFKVVSHRHTKDAQNRAHSLGAEDAKDVQQGKGGNGTSGKSWISRKLAFGAPVERGVQRHRSMDSEL